MKHLAEINPADLLMTVEHYLHTHYRFVTLTGVDNGDGTVDVLYHFDKQLQLETLRLTVSRETEVPSISHIYLAAAFVENEIQELLGVTINDKAINYGGRFILSEGAPETPFAKNITIVRKGENGGE